jgi:hypothetical protein
MPFLLMRANFGIDGENRSVEAIWGATSQIVSRHQQFMQYAQRTHFTETRNRFFPNTLAPTSSDAQVPICQRTSFLSPIRWSCQFPRVLDQAQDVSGRLARFTIHFIDQPADQKDTPPAQAHLARVQMRNACDVKWLPLIDQLNFDGSRLKPPTSELDARSVSS